MVFWGKKKRLIPKPGVFASKNPRPITCLNTLYEWFKACLLKLMDKHLGDYELMDKQQRGSKAGFSGTMDNLLIDRMVPLYCHGNKCSLSMVWIDVRKAYDSVDHGWLRKIMRVHRFPEWMCEVLIKLCTFWNPRVVANTKWGCERSEPICFDITWDQAVI